MLRTNFCLNLVPLFLVMIFVVIAQPAHALEIKELRFGTHPDKNRMVVGLSESSDFRVFALDDPYRLVVDLQNFNWKASSQKSYPEAGVNDLRHGHLQDGISRIVLDMNAPFLIQSAFVLPPQSGKPRRLVVDYRIVDRSAFLLGKSNIHGTLTPEENTIKTASSQARTAGRGGGVAIPQHKPASVFKPVIVIDPGHGGVDPGATAKNGLYEKNIVLKMAKELKTELEKTGQYKVILTRSSDHFIKLSDRVKFARAQKADLFVSIHADSIGKRNVRGASIYTLSEKASDAQTEKLAAKENRADLIGGLDLSTEDDEVAGILVDLAMRDTMNQSKFFANKLVGTMSHNGVTVLEKPHRYAGFAVLKAPDIPSVLIEAGFLSNQREAELLNTKAHRAKIISAIADGIRTYFDQARKNQRI